MKKSETVTETAPDLPQLPPVPKWQDDPRYVAAAGKLAELRAKQAEAEADQKKALRETGGTTFNPVEVDALRLFDPSRADAITAAFARLRDADHRRAAYARAVEMAAADEVKVREAVTAEVLKADLDGPVRDLERSAARAYLHFLTLSGLVCRRRYALQNSGLHLTAPPAFFAQVASIPTWQDLQVIGPELVARGYVTAAELADITIG